MRLTVEDTHHIIQKPVKMEFEIYDTALETLLSDSHDFKLFGYSTIEEFGESNISAYNKDLLIKQTHNTTMVNGGRLDILYRTNDYMLTCLNALYWESNKEESILARLTLKLESVACDDEWLEDVYSIQDIEDALIMLSKLSRTD